LASLTEHPFRVDLADGAGRRIPDRGSLQRLQALGQRIGRRHVLLGQVLVADQQIGARVAGVVRLDRDRADVLLLVEEIGLRGDECQLHAAADQGLH
jgi:hypothetical protein